GYAQCEQCRTEQEDGAEPDEGDEQLDQRVLHRYRRLATSAASTQRDPSKDGDVLVCANRALASRAARWRPYYRHSGGPARNADVEKRADARADQKREDRGDQH